LVSSEGTSLVSVAYNGSTIVVTAQFGYFYSTNSGTSWTYDINFSLTAVNQVRYIGNQFYMFAKNSTNLNIGLSTDGVIWTINNTLASAGMWQSIEFGSADPLTQINTAETINDIFGDSNEVFVIGNTGRLAKGIRPL
jgi:hypothetical protein